MNIFNRVLAILCLLGLVAMLVLAFLQPAATLGVMQSAVEGIYAFAVASYPVYLAAVAALIVVALVLLALELRRPRRLTVKVQQGSGGVVELATESVARGLEYHIAQLPGVTKVRPKVTSLGSAVRVVLDLETDPSMDVAGKSEEVLQLAHEIIQGRLGIKLAKVIVNLRQAAYYKDAAPPVRPKPPTADLPKPSTTDLPRPPAGDLPAQGMPSA